MQTFDVIEIKIEHIIVAVEIIILEERIESNYSQYVDNMQHGYLNGIQLVPSW